MKKTVCTLIFMLCSGCGSVPSVEAKLSSSQSKAPESALTAYSWHHGAQDCELNQAPEFQVFAHSETSYILRQNKCVSFEAPFIYVLLGSEKVLVLDTGATESGDNAPLYTPLYTLVRQLIDSQSKTQAARDRQILVWHSHGHGDHYRGDDQFRGQRHVSLLGTDEDEVNGYFGFTQTRHQTEIDLGDRSLTVIATPGHQEEAITVYDPQTKWLLTGDTFYPGYIYVKDWQDYRGSISRLSLFSQHHDVSAILGAHIEMKKDSTDYYPIGSQYQPNEAPLMLMTADLLALNAELAKSAEAKEIVSDRFIIAPMGTLQRALSNIARWLTQ
jgi:hydroxyacylglutathione hydrolase